MNKQIAGSTEKRSSFFRRSSLNAVPVSSQRASAVAGAAVTSTSTTTTRTHRHEVSFGFAEEGATSALQERQCEHNVVTASGDINSSTSPSSRPVTMATTVATNTTNADGESCPAPATTTILSDVSALAPTQVPTLCASFSLGLSTISERHSMEDDSLLHPVDGDVSRTNSSCSMPDYLCHKLHSVTVSVPPPATANNTTSTTIADSAASENEPAHVKATRNALGLSVAPPVNLAASSSASRLVKESCESSASTTTSESYQLSDLPPLPAKLATLSKPSSQALLASALRSRKARHSIDVRALPSYLARKRQSTFGQFLTALSPTAPEESSSSDDPLFSEPVAPTLSLGERVAWVKSSGPEFGVVKWIGRMPQITNDWTVGIEFDNAIGSGDGTVEGRRYFVAKENFAKFLPLSDLTKVDNYAGRPRSGTMLSRMSVQLKPGQLISIQRSPTTQVPHCYLNAPHHVGHDVHSPNNRHCQCHSCNHPCAHICKTRKPKGKRWTEDMAHMCHFSSKPHAHMCCGGEDLPSAANPIIEPGVSWKHSEAVASLRTVPCSEMQSRRKSQQVHAKSNSMLLQQQQQQQQQGAETALGGSKKSPRHQDVSPGFVREHHLPSNCSSALLERTGSDLSISSLPSSSSVAEVGYISRSVLTDESDIDSETERSLESNSKSGASKQGIRSLVACFIANSLRLKKPGDRGEKEKKEHGGGDRSARSGVGGQHGGKRVKKTSRSEKDKVYRSKQHRPLGLSSTDGSSYADIPPSNSQPLPSLPLDASRHANFEHPVSRPAVLFSSSPKYASTSAAAIAAASSAAAASSSSVTSNHVRNVKCSSRSSPFRSFGQQHHNIDGHISEEVTNSSHSSHAARQRMSSADRADSSDRTRPSTNASSENASSPRRRRNKGPAPKPPMTQCSSSPLSTTCNNVSTSCPSSVPPSPTNSSVVTSHSASSKSHLVLTSKSPAPLPPHLTRSLSEQKQLNMKNLINATHTFRSEVNLIQDAQSSAHSDAEQHSLPDELQLQLRENEENIVLVYEEGYSAQLIEKRNKQTTVAVTTTTTTADSQNHHHHHHHRHHHHHHDHQNRKAVTIKEDDTIYETPLPIKSLLADGGEILPPDLPTKTFDPLKMFGCRYNEETRRLERVVDADTGDGSTGMPRSLSMPVSQFTCCLHHWKEYLNALAKTDPAMMACNVQKDTETQSSNLKTAAEVSVKALPSNVHDCDCEHYHECLPASDLMNALLSPQHSLRYKKSRHDAALKKHAISPEHSANLGDHDPVPFSSFERCEFIRALSDGSLTNTSTATVVEFINEDSSNGDGAPVGSNLLMDDAGSGGCGGVKSGNGGKQHQQPNISNGSESLRSAVNQKCLSDVFCQTTFEDAPERPARRYKNHKYSCRCRHLKATRAHQGQSRHCRHRHCSAHHGECCSSVAAPAAAYFAGNDILRQAAVSSRNNVWLTSSTSDHSLSSSTSTLSEASTMRTSSTLSNDVSNCKTAAAAALGHLCSTSTMSPFGEPLVRFPHDNDGGFYSNTDTTLAEILSGRSPISTERLFKSAENNFPPPLVEAESASEFGSAFDPVQQLKSSSTPLANIFQELDTDVFLNTAESIPCKVNHEETQNNKCLMTELEMAIACGNHQRAAILAKELAIKRAHCSLTNKQYSGGGTGTIIKEKPARTSPIVAYLYIEERTTHRGPIPFQVYPSMSVNMLKLKVEKEFNIPSELQKWVLGRNIATNLSAALSTYGITNSGCPIFLYVLPSPQSAGAFSTLTSLVSMNKQSLVGEVAIKTNGNVSSDDDNIYESLRAPPPVLIPFPPYTESSSESSTLNRKSKVKSAGSSNKESADGCSGQPGNLAYFPATDNGAVGADSVQLVSNETSAHQLSQTTSQNSVKSYYYQEGEVQFANQLVFEGLSMVNELLPRVEEEDEDDLEEFEKEEKQLDEENDLMARNINGISELALATLNQVTTAAVSTYQKLVELEDVKCVRNIESFECPICFGRFKPGEGVVLRECLHTFCRDCLKGTIEYNEEVQVKCPFRDDLYSCDCALQDREIKELASSETYERYLKKSVSVAEKNVEKSFHCKSADCPGWCVYDDNVNVFNCPVCAHQNCINCQAMHEGSNCRQYQEELEFNAAIDEEAKKTKQFLEDMLQNEEALRCPQCKVIVMKKWGCDWVKCSMCDTEICWVTKSFRWGPKGRGDLTGGCRCMVNGIRCHANCKYCH